MNLIEANACHRLRALIGAPNELVEALDGLFGGDEIAFRAIARVEEEIGRSCGRDSRQEENDSCRRGHSLTKARCASRASDELPAVGREFVLEGGGGGFGVGKPPSS